MYSYKRNMIKTLNSILHQQHRAVICLNNDLNLVYCNSIAKKRLADTSCLRLNQTKLHAASKEKDNELKDALDAAIEHLKSNVIFLRAGTENRPCKLNIQPVLDTEVYLEGSILSVIIFIDYFNYSDHFLAQKFQQFYKLTEAEITLVRMLYDNLSLQECASIKLIKVSTVRWTLRNIFSKTETNSQKELIKLVGMFSD